MAVSRVFVRDLPPNITESDLRQHFEPKYRTTDVKLFAPRRFAYIGFETPEDAKSAVKHFTKSFIRLSRIHVELLDHSKAKQSSNIATKSGVNGPATPSIAHSLKRKRSTDLEPHPHRKGLSDGSKPPSNPPRPGMVRNGQNGQELRIPAGGEAKDATSVVEVETAFSAAFEPPANTFTENAADDAWIRSRLNRSLESTSQQEDDSIQGVDAVHGRPAFAGHGTAQAAIAELAINGATPDAASTILHAGSSRNAIPGIGAYTTQSGQAAEGTGNPQTGTESYARDRLFLRNLTHSMTTDVLTETFQPYGQVSEVHLSRDSETGLPKGFGFVQFQEPTHASAAMAALDGIVLQGRTLQVLPARNKPECSVDPLRSQSRLDQKRSERSADAYAPKLKWNAMYMNTDAVLSSISERLGISKTQIVDPTNSSSAVRQAQAEAHIIQESKAYFEAHGVNISALADNKRGPSDTAILVKNFKYGTSADDIASLFSQYGELSRLLMPPSGTIAILDYKQPAAARAAFRGLAYRKTGDSVLFLERAPKQLFKAEVVSVKQTTNSGSPVEASAEVAQDNGVGALQTATLFLRNLSFATTTEGLKQAFAPFEGFLSARVKTKVDPKRQGQVLSMGYGFLEFRNARQAKAVSETMQGFVLDGHELSIEASHADPDAAAQGRISGLDRKTKPKGRKLIVKNLPFEASKKDITALLSSYGKLRAVRVPRKFNSSRKGFAFAEFTTALEAESALSGLRDTHLLGRRLVLEYASGDADDPEAEIAEMQRKIGKQSNSVALSNLTASSMRRKFAAEDEESSL